MHLDNPDMTIVEVEARPTMDQMMLPLSEFLECFTSPQCGKIIDGYPQDFDAYDAFDIPKGCSLTFHRKVNPNVPLSFMDSWGGATAGHWLLVTIPIENQCRFKFLPYDPLSGDDQPDHIYHTVDDLAKAFPVFVQANASYGDKIDDPTHAFSCGDRLKLIRLLFKNGIKFMECRPLTEPHLILLPMECVGDFTALPDNNTYLLADIVGMLPRRRRVKIATDSPKHPIKLPGLPSNYTGELFIEEPETFIEASPVSDTGLIIGLPCDLDIMVSPDQIEKGQLFGSFINSNRNLLPVICRVSDWSQETTILENHFVKPGGEIVIHGWTKQSKVLAMCGEEYYAIPLTYTGKFRIKPKTYQGVTELERAYPGNKLQVVSVDPEDIDFPLREGDIIRIKREDTLKRKAFREVEIRCEKYDRDGKSREMKLPLGSPAVFEEVLEEGRSNEYSIKELVSFVSDQELVVEVTKRSCDQKVKGRDLIIGTSILLCDFVIEPAVYVSVDSPDAPSFHIPLRTLLYVTFTYQLDRSASPLLTKNNPRLSTLDRCAEVLSFEVFTSLRPQRALETVQSFGRAAAQNPTHAWVADGTVAGSAWPAALRARDYDLSGKARKPPSVAESDMAYGSKSKGMSKLKTKFRRHKSQENIFRSSSPSSVSTDFAPLSIAKQDIEYTRSSLNDNVILAERSVSVQNGQLRVTTPDSYGKGSIASESSVDMNGEGSQSLSSSSTPQSPASSVATPHVTTVKPPRTTSNTTSQITSHVTSQPQGNLARQQRHEVTTTVRQNGMNGRQNAVNGVNGVNNVHRLNTLQPQSSLNSVSSDGVSSSQVAQAVNVQTSYGEQVAQAVNVQTSYGEQVAQAVNVPPGYALVQSQTSIDQSGNETFGSLPQLPQGSPGYMLVPVMSSEMLEGMKKLYRNHSVSSGADDEDDEYDSGVQDISFKKTKFKLVIPPDGNIYHFSVKKMGEFLRQMRIDDPYIENCIKHKIDGKKFSKLTQDDLKKLGILHPLVAYFRKLTGKSKAKFML